MKLSEKRRTEVYAAIADPIMDLRIETKAGRLAFHAAMDDELFKLQHEIWRRVFKALNLDGPT